MSVVLYKCALCKQEFEEKDIKIVPDTGAYLCKKEYEELVKEGYIPVDDKFYKCGVW